LSKMIIDCPICKSSKSLKVTTKTQTIPYFGEIMESTLICQKCGYKYSDTICIDQKEPVKYTIILNKEKLNVRVVKSQSATLTIPELGLRVEPGPQSQGYISNVEGVLKRFEDAVKTALSWTEDSNARNTALKILNTIESVKIGEGEVTLILEDPFGHSSILDEDAVKTGLKEDEIKKLKTSFLTFE
jgi:zinc finger protein ZPR1